MTFTEDFLPSSEGQRLGTPARTYPTVFNIALTPNLIGILVAVVGGLAFLFLLLNLVKPAWEKHQELQASLDKKQTEVQQKQTGLAQSQKVRTELAQAKQQQTEVLSLFADENTLNTLALDLDRLAEDNNAKANGNGVKAKITKYTPVVDLTQGVVSDGSLGAEVNGKLKSQVVDVAVEGTYEQTELILQDIERLQSLLIVKDYQSTSLQTPLSLQGRSPQTISTSFKLQALIPLSPEETAKASAPDAAAKQPPK